MLILPPQPYPFDDLPEPLDEDEQDERVFEPGYDMFDECSAHTTYLCMLALLDEYKR